MTKEEAGKPRVLNFIRDTAAAEDAFGSHDRVAGAIADVIVSAPEVKVVGLLGPWGSGKSTVVRKIGEALNTQDCAKATHVFCYDAWLYQSDPQRRSFLETFLRFMIDAGLTTEVAWKSQLDQLSRKVEESETTTTPALTGIGKAALAVVFVVALGMQFVGWDVIDAAFGDEASLRGQLAFWFGFVAAVVVPIATLIGILMWLRPVRTIWSKAFWTKANWTTNRAGYEEVSVMGLLVNRSVERQRQRLTRDPEPTAIEFQKIFRSILASVAADDRRFLIIIDNLDRLHEAEAMAMWGTIRSFFLGAPAGAQPIDLPVIILPIDEAAVARMYEAERGGEGGGAAARAFMDKTFDLTFLVAPPVMTGWRDYLAGQMAHVFGDHLQDDWVFVAARVLERRWLQGERVTPRSINIAINGMATLWLQRGAEPVGFPAIALYAVFRDLFEKGVRLAIENPAMDMSDRDPEWATGVAALHFGVPIEMAAQVLMEADLRRAIGDRDVQEFRALSAIPGFAGVFQALIDATSVSPMRGFAVNAVILFAELAPEKAPWTDTAWRSLRRMLIAVPDWQSLDEADQNAIATLLKEGGTPQLSAFIRGVTKNLEQVYFGEPDESAPLMAVIRALAETANANGLSPPRVTIQTNAAGHLRGLSMLRDSAVAAKTLQSPVPDNALGDELARQLQVTTANETLYPAVEALLLLDWPGPWDKAVAASLETVENQNVSHPGMQAAVHILTRFVRSDQKAAVAGVKRLASSGVLTARLEEAVNADLDQVVARLIYLILINKASIRLPRSWSSVLERRPELVGQIDAELRWKDGPAHVDKLIQAVRETPNFESVVKAVVAARLRAYGHMGRFAVGDAVADPTTFLDAVGPDLEEAFAKGLTLYDTFWKLMDEAAFDEGRVRLVRLLTTDEDAEREKGAPRAFAWLKTRLEAVDVSTWRQALVTETQMLPAARTLAQREAFTLGGPLIETLEEAAPGLLSDFDATRARLWFDAAALLSANARRTLFRTLRDKIVSGVAIADVRGLMDAGGTDFLKAGEFSKSADAAVRHIVLPLAVQDQVWDWMWLHRVAHASWIKGAKAETRGFLYERLADRWRQADTDTQDRLQQLAAAYRLASLAATPS